MRTIIILLLFTSCSTLYTPNTRNAPLFREQGEAQLSGYLTSAGIEGQVAYALTDHIAAIGSYVYGSSKETKYTYKNSYGEIGFGFFDRSRSARYEILGGYGFGQSTSYDQYSFFGLNNTVEATAKMQRIFIQPSIGTNGRNFNLIFTPRLTWVDYTEFSTSASVPPPLTNNMKPNEKAQIFLEPALTTKFRLQGNLHGIFQLGIALPMNGEVYYKYQSLQATIGIQIDTGGLRTKVY